MVHNLKISRTRIFPKNRAPSLLSLYGPHAKFQRKSLETILRKVRHRRTDRLTDGQTDEHKFIGHLRPKGRGPITIKNNNNKNNNNNNNNNNNRPLYLS